MQVNKQTIITIDIDGFTGELSEHEAEELYKKLGHILGKSTSDFPYFPAKPFWPKDKQIDTSPPWNPGTPGDLPYEDPYKITYSQNAVDEIVLKDNIYNPVPRTKFGYTFGTDFEEIDLTKYE